eukprot:259939_1
MKSKLQHEKRRQEEINGESGGGENEVAQEKIEALTNEKKQVFKTMLKERKNVAKLEEDLEEYKQEITSLEEKMTKLRYEKNKALQRAQDAERKRKDEQKRHDIVDSLRKGSDDREDSATKNRFAVAFKKPNMTLLPAFSNKPKDPPFRVKAKNNPHNLAPKKYDSDDARSGGNASSDDGGSMSVQDEESESEEIKKQSTEELDKKNDPDTESTHVYSWLFAQKVETKSDKKQLKTRLASLL